MDHRTQYVLAPQRRFGLSFCMSPIDFRAKRLFVDGYRAKHMLVVSLAAKRFWRLAFHDIHLTSSHYLQATRPQFHIAAQGPTRKRFGHGMTLPLPDKTKHKKVSPSSGALNHGIRESPVTQTSNHFVTQKTYMVGYPNECHPWPIQFV